MIKDVNLEDDEDCMVNVIFYIFAYFKNFWMLHFAMLLKEIFFIMVDRGHVDLETVKAVVSRIPRLIYDKHNSEKKLYSQNVFGGVDRKFFCT